MVASALLGLDTAGLDTYSEATCADAKLVAMRDKVAIDLMQSPWPQHTLKAEVTVETTDGQHLKAAYDASIPETDLAAQGTRLDAKFDALAGGMLGAERAGTLKSLLGRLENVTTKELMAACAR
jgi:hypothetical protein